LIINSLIIIKTLILKIPPDPAYRTGRLPFPKGGIKPLFAKEG
jgi:hypothetical protein